MKVYKSFRLAFSYTDVTHGGTETVETQVSVPISSIKPAFSSSGSSEVWLTRLLVVGRAFQGGGGADSMLFTPLVYARNAVQNQDQVTYTGGPAIEDYTKLLLPSDADNLQVRFAGTTADFSLFFSLGALKFDLTDMQTYEYYVTLEFEV